MEIGVTNKLIEEELHKKSVGLNFPPVLEKKFRRDYLHRSVTQTRVFIVLGLVLYGIFGILDYFIIPDYENIWLIRYAIVCPVIALVLLYSFYVTQEKYMRLVFSAGILVGGYGIIAMLVVSSTGPEIGLGAESHIYYGGLMLMVFGAYVLVTMRFYFSTMCGWLLTVSYVVFSILMIRPKISTPILINNTFFLVSANFVGMMGSYMLEKYIRKDFLMAQLLESANRQLEQLSLIDGLTGIANRRCFDHFLTKEWFNTRRRGEPISLLMMDIDYFKAYNDFYGHQAGDDCIAMVAAAANESVRRAGDLSARYGGEEFAVILSGTGLDEAKKIAEALRIRIKDMKMPHSTSKVHRFVTVSIGVSSVVPSDVSDKGDLVDAADRALYQAKGLGRNRVVAIDMESEKAKTVTFTS